MRTLGEYQQMFPSHPELIAAEFEALQRDERRGRRSLMDHYGATNPAEFFAVATETFFEKPERMAREHADLFAALRAYYRIDPRDWSDPRAETRPTAS